MKKATFAAGCFWGVEATFRNVDGVLETAVGYIGGTTENPSYKDVCTGKTDHAEVVEIDFDPEKVTFEQLLEVFWKCHDPTTLNRQGPDIGTQYRSEVFFHSDDQRKAATKSREDAQSRFSQPIVTEITAASTFYRAEEYHQCYLERRGFPSCH